MTAMRLPSPEPRRGGDQPLASRLKESAEMATRLITVSATVLIIHLAVLKYIFLATRYG